MVPSIDFLAAQLREPFNYTPLADFRVFFVCLMPKANPTPSERIQNNNTFIN